MNSCRIPAVHTFGWNKLCQSYALCPVVIWVLSILSVVIWVKEQRTALKLPIFLEVLGQLPYYGSSNLYLNQLRCLVFQSLQMCHCAHIKKQCIFSYFIDLTQYKE